jgi:3-isopropylmalate/(R)-2-methylmalate dehydratase small subunit
VEPFTRVEAVAAPMDLANVDTDRIIPARFLRKSQDEGYGDYFFRDVRLRADGSANPDFVLNQPPYRDAKILVTAENFGCGSSREGAVWALAGWGIRAVIGPSFGDIFFQNCAKNGVLAVVLPAEAAATLRRQLHERPGSAMSVDLPSQTVTGPDGATYHFDVDGFRKQCLLRGQDEIALTSGYEPAIAAFEARARDAMSWLE